jgi:type VI protein secretion system component VasK
MKPKDILSILGEFFSPDPKLLALLGLVVPLLIAGGLWLYKFVQERRKKAARGGPNVQTAPGELPAEPELSADQLLDSWKRFLRRLPRRHQRSMLNYDHFVVMGAAAAGKSRLLDTQSDWLFQMKQVARDAPVDPAFPFYLGSGAVIGELPARYLFDSSDRCRKALDVLWRRLYRHRGPTVLVAVDAIWLSSATRDEIAELGRAVRMQVNHLSSIRGRAIEARIALTHLDMLKGFNEAAKFWEKAEIANRIPLALDGAMGPSLQAWAQETQHQLPRALTALSAAEYRSMLAFVRRLPEFLVPLEQLLSVLWVHDPASLPPVRGGVYLCTDMEGDLSPISQAHESGPGPDPTRRHLIGITAAASACVTYFGFAYAHQYEAWKPAAAALAGYEVSPSTVGSEVERTRRRAIDRFTVEHRGLIARFPGFFDAARAEMKQKFTGILREHLLVPTLRHMALIGVEDSNGNTLRWRRSIYCLGVIHSDNADRLGIRARKDDLWPRMTGLSREVIEDYLANSDTAYAEPVTFELQTDTNPDDLAEVWLEVPEAIHRILADKLLTEAELSTLKARSKALRKALARFEHDEVTVNILKNLDLAADTATFDGVRPRTRLTEVYDDKYRHVMGICEHNKMHEQFTVLGQVFALVASTKFRQLATGSAAGTLPALVDDLTVLRDSPPILDVDAESITVELANREIKIDVRKWTEALNHSQAEAAVGHFMSSSHARPSVFFTPSVDAGLPDIVWNASGSDATLFVGRARLSGRYTATGFEKGVRRPLERLNDVLAGFKFDPATLVALESVIKSAVAQYALHYNAEAQGFLRSFRINAHSAEALRVILGQVAAEKSSFDEFVNLLDVNTDLELEPPKPKLEEPKGSTTTASTVRGAAPTDETAAGGKLEASAEKDTVAANARAETDAPAPPFDLLELLSPLQQGLAGFEPWHRAIGARRGGAELTKYKEIAKQLLSDLSAIAEAPPAPPKDDPESDAALETELSATGRASLAVLRADAGAYYAMAQAWAAGSGLSHEQRQPFLAPFAQLSHIGEHDIADVVRRVWKTEMRPLVREVANRFPFNRTAQQTVDPEELTDRFHPTEGRFFQLFRSYLEPLSSFGEGQPFRPLPSARAAFQFPPDLYPTVNAVAALSARLWDEKGDPRPLEVRVSTVPFVTEPKAQLVPTVVHFNVGKVSLFNFNQRPEASTLALDWMQDDDAQLALHVTDVATGETTYPAALAAPGKYWRFFRLLRAAKVHTSEVDGSQVYEWERPIQDGNKRRVRVRLKLEEDPWHLLGLGGESEATR